MPVSEHAELLEILGSIYDWSDALPANNRALEAAMLLLGGTKAVLFRLDSDDIPSELIGDAGFAHGVASTIVQSHTSSEQLGCLDSDWVQDHVIDSARVNFGSPVPDREDEPTEGLHHCLLGAVYRDAAGSGLICIYRPVSSGEFSDIAPLLLAKMLPHWRRALEQRVRRESADDMAMVLRKVLDNAPYSIMVVDASANVLYENDLPEHSCLVNDGVALRNGRLAFASPEISKQFSALLDEQSPDGVAKVMLNVGRPSGAKPYQVLVWPVQVDASAAARFAVFINDPLYSLPVDTDALRVLGELTRAESRLCVSFYSTKNLGRSAEELGVSASTAKTHLLSIFRKLNINSQPELISYLAAMPKLAV